MTPLHPARRRAERFDSLLEGSRGADDAIRDAHTAELLELVGALRSIPATDTRAEARPEFVSSLRERLMLAAETELAPVDVAIAITRKLTLAPRKTGHERRVAVALGAFAIVGATTSMAVAAQSALPGDALYPLKRAIENTHTSLSVGDESKGSTLLGNAGNRLGEVKALTKNGNADPAEVRSTLDAFTAETNQAVNLLMQDYQKNHDESAIDELRDFAASSMNQLAALEQNVPDGAEATLTDAAHNLFLVDAAAGQVCPQCSSTGITEIPPTLLASGGDSLDTAEQQLSAGGPLGSAAPQTAGGGNPALVTKPGKQPGSNGPGGPGGSGGQTAPSNPVTLPTTLPTTPPVGLPTPSTPPAGGLGGIVPSIVNDITGGPSLSGGKSGKPKPHHPVSAPAVGDLVSDVASGVASGVGAVVGGLTGRS